MEFKGKIGNKGIENMTSKKGTSFKVFSAFSSDKDGENRAFTWVKFIVGKTLDINVNAGEYVEVHGDMQLDVYKNKLQFGCRTTSVSHWDLKANT